MLGLSLVAVPQPASAAGVSELRVFPSTIHMGDTLYLSGTALGSHVQKIITIACPNVQVQYPGSSIETKPGPMTNRNGQFQGYQFTYSPLSVVRAPLQCSVYANRGNDYVGVDIPGTYEIVPNSERLDRCARQICGLQVKPQPTKVHAGFQENIHLVGGWAGALAIISVLFPGSPQQTHHVRLNWNGEAYDTFPVPTHLSGKVGVMAAMVSVVVQLGNVHGSGKGKFIVIR
jgi:hypothetical protein